MVIDATLVRKMLLQVISETTLEATLYFHALEYLWKYAVWSGSNYAKGELLS